MYFFSYLFLLYLAILVDIRCQRKWIVNNNTVVITISKEIEIGDKKIFISKARY
jgi:hypothetical protein